MNKITKVVLATVFAVAITLSGCGFLENIAGSDPIINLLGLDYSACVADKDSFDTCFEFLRDNDQQLLGEDLNELIIRKVLESLNSNGIPTVTASDL